MKHTSDFDIDLEKGQIAEKLLEEILIGSEDKIKIEVKTDFKAHKTKRLFFEYSDRGKLSGLAITKADWWAHVVPDKAKEELKNEKDIKFIMFIETTYLKKTLKKLLKQKKAWKLLGGDEDKAKGVLVEIETLILELIKEKKIQLTMSQQESLHKEPFQQELGNILKRNV